MRIQLKDFSTPLSSSTYTLLLLLPNLRSAACEVWRTHFGYFPSTSVNAFFAPPPKKPSLSHLFRVELIGFSLRSSTWRNGWGSDKGTLFIWVEKPSITCLNMHAIQLTKLTRTAVHPQWNTIQSFQHPLQAPKRFPQFQPPWVRVFCGGKAARWIEGQMGLSVEPVASAVGE